jgi:glucose/arabinose dehydrogenase
MPLYSKGMDYDGTPVEYGRQLGIALDLAAIEQPVVDMTRSPAVSSFILYRGDAFPEWHHNVIVGTLKATARVYPAGSHTHLPIRLGLSSGAVP